MYYPLFFLFCLLLSPQASFADTCSSQFHSSIPVLDMQNYYKTQSRPEFIQQLRKALREVGFFAVINTPMDGVIIDNAYGAAKEFFKGPMEEKMRLNKAELCGQRGYVPGESAKGKDLKDFKEFFHMGKEISDKERLKQGLKANLWPEDNYFKPALCHLYKELENYKKDLETALSLALEESPDFLSKMTLEGDTLLRAIHYPKNCPKNQVWAEEHTDIDLFTIIPRPTSLGLEVKNKKGEWISVQVPKDAMIINAGDMLKNLSNGEFLSSLHRVVSRDHKKERYSMVLFVHAKSSLSMAPLKKSIARTGGVRRYAQVSALELLEERLADLGLASDAMLQHLAKSQTMERLLEVNQASQEAMQHLKNAGYASLKVEKALEEMAKK